MDEHTATPEDALRAERKAHEKTKRDLEAAQEAVDTMTHRWLEAVGRKGKK